MTIVTICRPLCGNAVIPLPEPPPVWVPTATSAAASTQRTKPPERR